MKTILLTVIIVLGLPLSHKAQVYSYPVPLTSSTLGIGHAKFAKIGGAGHWDIAAATYSDFRMIWYNGDGDGAFLSENENLENTNHFQFLMLDIDTELSAELITIGLDGLIRMQDKTGLDSYSTPVVIGQFDGVYRQSEVFDYDQDGREDLFLTTTEAGISVRLNQGDGTLSTSVITSFSDEGPIKGFDFGDINGDGLADICFTTTSGKLMWAKGTAGGGFNSLATIHSGMNNPRRPHVLDFDYDGDMDVVMAVYVDGEIMLFKNTPAIFDPENVYWVTDVLVSSPWSQDVQAIDLDDDGDRDLAVATDNGLYRYDQQSGLTPWSSATTMATYDSQFTGLDAEDIDFDGQTELLLSSSAFDGLIFFDNNPTVGIQAGLPLSSGAVDIRAITLADVDGDGDKDVISAADDTGSWYENEGQGARNPRQLISDQLEGAWAVLPVTDPSDADDDVIFWIGDQFNADLVLSESNNGSFVDIPLASIPQVISSTSANMQSTARTEVLFGSAFNSGRLVYYGQFPQGGGYIQTVAENTSAIHSVTTADMSGDGAFEILSHNGAFGDLYMYSRTGALTWDSGVIIGDDSGLVFDYNSPITPIDFDQDGDMDVLIFSVSTGNPILHLIRQGDNLTFTNENLGVFANNDNVLIAGDVEGDGDIDVLTIGDAENELRWHLNDGNGALLLSSPVNFNPDYTEPITHALADDADGDGDLDVYFVADVIYYSENSGIFCPEDINRDGWVDVLDFIELNSQFGVTCLGYCPADINGDGIVNIEDFIRLNTEFGGGCN